MTTFHDPHPHSRRAARQSERERASDEQPTVEGFTFFPSQEAEENRVDETPERSNVETATASAPSQTDSAGSTPPAVTDLTVPPAPVSSRPSADAAYRAAPPPSPQTQNSALAPPEPTGSPPAPHTSAQSLGLPSTSSAGPAASETNAPERTLTRRELRELRARQEAEVSGTASANETAVDANADAVPHYPYSNADGKPTTPPSPQALTIEQAVPAYMEPPALVDPLAVVPEAASVNAPAENALSAFESLLANADGSAKDEAVNDSPRSPLIDPLLDSGPAKSVSELNFGGAGTLAALQQTTPDAAVSQQSGSAAEPKSNVRSTLAGLLGFGTDNAPAPSDDEPVEKAANAATNLSNARAEFDEQARKRLDGELPPVSSTPAATSIASMPAPSGPAPAPAAPWSRQAATNEEQSDSVISRTIGSGSSTTSALVLPAIPFATDIRGPLNASGEAMLTGSIDLPSTLSASGVSDRFDHADIDSLLDLNDSDMVSTDSAPVRAVKAVSTFSNQSVTQTQKPKGTRALTVLLISASSMAVVVAGLLVAAFAFNML